MALLFIRQQSNGPERNANLMPRGVSPGEVSADGDAPREKGCRIRSGPLLEDATDEKEKFYERRHREGSALHVYRNSFRYPSSNIRSTSEER